MSENGDAQRPLQSVQRPLLRRARGANGLSCVQSRRRMPAMRRTVSGRLWQDPVFWERSLSGAETIALVAGLGDRPAPLSRGAVNRDSALRHRASSPKPRPHPAPSGMAGIKTLGCCIRVQRQAESIRRRMHLAPPDFPPGACLRKPQRSCDRSSSRVRQRCVPRILTD